MKLNTILFLFIILIGALANPTYGTNCSESFLAEIAAKSPRLVIFSAPSGGGKTTLARKLIAEFPEQFAFSVSTTTRAPRGSEKNGVDYFFASQAEFQKKIKAGAFIEWAEVHGNFYGTERKQIEDHLKAGRSVLLAVDIQGAAAIRRAFPGNSYSVFITPPSLKILEERLRARGTDSEEAIQKRLKNAIEEMKHQGEFNSVLVNDNLERAYGELKSLLL